MAVRISNVMHLSSLALEYFMNLTRRKADIQNIKGK